MGWTREGIWGGGGVGVNREKATGEGRTERRRWGGGDKSLEKGKGEWCRGRGEREMWGRGGNREGDGRWGRERGW